MGLLAGEDKKRTPQLTHGHGDTQTPVTLASHSLVYTTLSAGTYSHYSTHPGLTPTYTRLHTGAHLTPTQESGTVTEHVWHTGIPSQSHPDSQMHAGTMNTQIPLTHTDIQIRTDTYMNTGAPEYHPSLTYARLFLYAQPH